MKGCGINQKKKRSGEIKRFGKAQALKKMARQGGVTNIMCALDINIMDDKYAYYASQAVYGSGVHHEYLSNQGYVLDQEFTSNNTRTYVKDGQALVAYKGTNPLNIVDLDADAAIAIGTQRLNPQFVKASDLAKRVREKYGNITTTGHSLGGTKAIESANDAGGKAIVFNPGTGLYGLKTGDHRVYVKNQDPISIRVKGDNVFKSDGGHSLDGYKRMFEPRVTGSAPMTKSNIPIMSGVRRGVSKKRGWRV